MKFDLKGFYKPTPVQARKIGDALLLTSSLLAAVAAYAVCPVCTFLAGITGVIGKFITNFFVADNQEKVT